MAKLVKKELNAVPNISNDNWNVEAMQEFNRRAIYKKGFQFTTGASPVTNDFQVPLGGLCRQLYGIVMFFPTANVNDDDIISLNINSELVIDKSNWKAFSPATSGNTFKPNEYYQLKRALSGQDTVQLTVSPVNAKNFWIIFYLSGSNLPQV